MIWPVRLIPRRGQAGPGGRFELRPVRPGSGFR